MDAHDTVAPQILRFQVSGPYMERIYPNVDE